MPDWSKVKVPLFSAANWGGQGLHPRGNFEGFVRSASKQKWLEVPRHRALDPLLHRLRRRPAEEVLRPFPQGRGDRLGQAAEGAAPGAPSRREVRRAARERMAARAHAMDQVLSSIRRLTRCRPTPQTKASSRYLCGLRRRRHLPDRAARSRTPRSPGRSPPSCGCRRRPRMPTCSWWCARSSPDMKEVVFQGALDPHTPIAQGWLRVSHRKLDPKLTLPYRPYHTHDEEQKLKPGRSTRSTSRSGRPASWCRRAIALRSPCAARITSIGGGAGAA